MIDVSLAGLTFSCALRYPETARFFPKPDPAAIRVGGEPVCLTDGDWAFYRGDGIEDGAYSEFSLLTAAFSDALMDHDRIIIHAVAIRWQDRAYLIAAQPGVGKSTQARFLQQLRPGEFSVICGDRPVLEFRPCEPVTNVTGAANRFPSPVSGHCETSPQTGRGNPSSRDSILVHPSLWNGKENWYGAEAAPLEGLILLRRGDQNELISLTAREAAIRVYTQMIQLYADGEKIRKAAELTTRLLNNVPIWQLTSFQVPDSTRLLLNSLF